uniref:Ig-like domain-containing protein n=1 Tax=Lates calcarifer TaxID=8187 RepID=A0A4W6D7K0_LATCA
MTLQRMSRLSCVLSVLLLLTLTTGDTEVSCVFMESCILPCSFQYTADIYIHWIQETEGHPPVHSFYYNKDQLGLQDQFFRGRTSLFKDQISRGNASLQLTGVEVQDQGRYRCHTSTMRGNKDSFINLRVDAPVSKVNMEQVGNRIICSSEGIYPKPDLTWSTSPPSNLNLQNQSSIQQTEQQLYNISSSLILSDSETDLIYICTISTRKNWRRVTLFKTSKHFKHFLYTNFFSHYNFMTFLFIVFVSYHFSFYQCFRL